MKGNPENGQRMCSLRSRAADVVSASQSHREAIQTLVMSVFPSAFIAFTQGSSVVENQPNEIVDKLCQRHQYCGATSPLSEALRATRGPFADCCNSGSMHVWSRLYQRWPPSLVAGRRLWRTEEQTSSLSLPCWTPHAVVYIGGYEATDLRRVVAPQLFAQVPPFSADDAVKQTVGGLPFDYDRRRVPKYAAHVLNESVLLQEKGCAIHEPDLLEITIPTMLRHGERNQEVSASSLSSLSGAGAAAATSLSGRIQVFLSFASPETTIHMLQRAVEPIQRVALRPAFGFSQSTLRYSLPPPVLTAMRLLRRWNAVWSPNPLSAPFWLSAVGHAVEQLSQSGVDPLCTQFTLNDLEICDKTNDNNDVREVAMRLAVAAASCVNSGLEECYANYFLPAESFEEERSVREMRNYVGHLPIQRLQDGTEV